MSETLPQLWHATVARTPEAIAIVTAADGRTWKRADLASAGVAWAAQVPAPVKLTRRKVALCVANGFGWWEAFLGLLELDAVPVVIDVSEPRHRRLEIATDAGAVAMWSDGEWVRLDRRSRPTSPDTCLIKLTSGSTGRPKAWSFTHRQMIADGQQVCSTMGIGPNDLNLAAIPLGHSYGLGNLVVPLLVHGTGAVLVDSPLPNVLAAAAKQWRPTVFPAVPALLDVLLRSSVDSGMLSHLRLVVSAGATMPPALARDFQAKFGLTIHNFYGSSETGGICYDRSGEATLSGRSVGSPMDGVNLRWRTGHRFRVESAAVGGRGSFSPLDFGRLNEQGELVLIGRSGRLVKIGARRVDLGEIETVLKALPGVRDAYATLLEEGRHAIAVVVATDRNKQDIRAALCDKLPTWKLPHKIVTLPALIYTPRGKLDRAAIEKQLIGAQSKPAAND